MQYLSAFLDVVHQSGLIDRHVLNQAVDEFKVENVSGDANAFAKSLVQKKILTRWQSKHLLKGKHRGFFVGQYKILNILGRGGHSNVYLAEHITLKQKRVVKVLTKDKINGKTSLAQRFLREAQATARLDHPNVIKCYDVVMENDLSYLVLEYISGQDLYKLVKEKGPLRFIECVDYIIQVAQGLKYTQEQGMIHRDMKPSNLLLTDDGHVKILDLGLAMLERDGHEDGSLTEMYNDNLGTADYVAPEQALSSHDVDFRADIYSLGCTLYYLIVGRPPFDQGSIMQRVAQHQTQMPETISAQRPKCPKLLEQICWKMMQKSPDQRFQSYDALISALQNLLKKARPRKTLATVPVVDPVDHLIELPDSVEVLDDDEVLDDALGTPLAEVPIVEVAPQPVDTSSMSAAGSATAPPFAQPTDSSITSGSTSNLPPFDPNAGFDISNVDLGTVTKPTPATSSIAQPATTHPHTATASSQKRAEDDAYQKFVSRERLKMVWVGIGLTVGIGIAVAAFLLMSTMSKIQEDKRPPAATQFEEQ